MFETKKLIIINSVDKYNFFCKNLINLIVVRNNKQMDTLAERIKYVIYKLGLNQAEIAKMSGISQQSINYIIRKNLAESRLSSKIAEGLNINPEWLIYGKGEIVSPKIYKIPVINDYLSLQIYLSDRRLDDDVVYLLTSRFISAKPFAVKTDNNKICICKNSYDSPREHPCGDYLCGDYLYFNNKEMRIITRNEHNGLNRKFLFKISEWRIYDIKV